MQSHLIEYLKRYFEKTLKTLGRECVSHPSCLTLCDPVDCGPPGSVRGVIRARILDCVAISFSRDLPHLGIKPVFLASPALAGRFFNI